MTPTNRSGLLRTLRRWDLIAIVVNGVIGAGIFGLPSRVFALIGSYSLVAFVICAVCVLVIVFAFAEVASRYTESGGPYLYAYEAFGPRAAFAVGWLMWMTRVTAFAANANLLPVYLGLVFPKLLLGRSPVLLLTAVAIALTFLNSIGVEVTAKAGIFLAFAKLLPLALLAVGGLFFINPSNFQFHGTPAYASFSSAVLLLVYAFTGFEMAVIPAGETKSPRDILPFALGTGIGIVVVFYIAIQAVCIGLLPHLAASQRPLADAAERFLGYGGSLAITVGVTISILGNLNVQILSGSRMMYAIAERGDLPKSLAFIHPSSRTPITAVLFTGGVMLMLAVSGTFTYLLTISTLSRLITYVVTCCALPVLRRSKTAPRPAFLLHGGNMVAVIGVILCLWLLSNSTAKEARDTFLALMAGVVISIAYRLFAPRGQARAN